MPADRLSVSILTPCYVRDHRGKDRQASPCWCHVDARDADDVPARVGCGDVGYLAVGCCAAGYLAVRYGDIIIVCTGRKY